MKELLKHENKHSNMKHEIQTARSYHATRTIGYNFVNVCISAWIHFPSSFHTPLLHQLRTSDSYWHRPRWKAPHKNIAEAASQSKQTQSWLFSLFPHKNSTKTQVCFCLPDWEPRNQQQSILILASWKGCPLVVLACDVGHCQKQTQRLLEGKSNILNV